MLRFVQHPSIRPQRCACVPNIGAGNEPVGFFDFGTDLDIDHVYVSHTAFRQMAELAGYVPAAGSSLEVARLRERLDEAEGKLRDAEKALGAVEVLKQSGFAQARRPGRPKKEVAA